MCGYFYPLELWVMALKLWVIEREYATAAIGGERENVGSFGSPLGDGRRLDDPTARA